MLLKETSAQVLRTPFYRTPLVTACVNVLNQFYFQWIKNFVRTHIKTTRYWSWRPKIPGRYDISKMSVTCNSHNDKLIWKCINLPKSCSDRAFMWQMSVSFMYQWKRLCNVLSWAVSLSYQLVHHYGLTNWSVLFMYQWDFAKTSGNQSQTLVILTYQFWRHDEVTT